MKIITRTGGKNELGYQNEIMKSYEHFKGRAYKWATETSVGKPDLVCCLPRVGLHLAEVKHRPTFGLNKIQNPMTEKQKQVLQRYHDAGAMVVLYIVSGPDKKDSKLWAFNPLLDYVDPKDGVYIPRIKKVYDVDLLMASYVRILKGLVNDKPEE